MSNAFTLDSLREEIEKEFAPAKVGLKDGSEVVLRNLLRLDGKERDKVIGLLEGVKGAQDEDLESAGAERIDEILSVVQEILKTVAETKGTQLVKELGEDLILTMKVLERWMGDTQPGEAESLPS